MALMPAAAVGGGVLCLLDVRCEPEDLVLRKK